MDHQAFAQLLGNYGEIIGAIAVVVTLFYLALQVRHSKEATEANTRSMDESRKLAMSQAYQARSEPVVKLNLEFAKLPQWLKLNAKLRNIQQEPVELEAMLNTLTDDELSLLRTTEMAKRMILDSSFYQHQLGFLDDEYYESTFVPSIRAWAPTWKALGLLTNVRASFACAIDQILSIKE